MYRTGTRRALLKTSAAVSSDSVAATNFLARTSGLDATHTNAYKTLLNGLTTDSFFDGSGTSLILDALYIMATQDSTTAKLNLISSSFALVETATVTFTADQGYAGDGGSGHLSTQLAPSGATFYTQNSASYGYYSRTASPANNGRPMGFRDGFDVVDGFIDIGGGGTQTILRINESIGTSIVVGSAGNGLWAVRRSGSTATKAYSYQGASPTTATGTGVSTGVSANAFWLLGANLDGSANGTTTDQLASAFVGASLTDGQADNLAARINTFLTSVGANVY